MSVESLDHLVLTVRNIATTVAFYERVLGVEARTFGDRRRTLHFGDQKLNLHEVGQMVDPNVRHATPGSSGLCFLTRLPIPEVIRHLADCGVAIIAGPSERTGLGVLFNRCTSTFPTRT